MWEEGGVGGHCEPVGAGVSPCALGKNEAGEEWELKGPGRTRGLVGRPETPGVNQGR